jgi:hypothetical protein
MDYLAYFSTSFKKQRAPEISGALKVTIRPEVKLVVFWSLL